MTLEQIASKFENPKKHGNGFQCLCPAHADSSPSLSIHQNSNKILIKCFAGCKTKDILAAVGLKMSDLYIESITYSNPSKKRATVQGVSKQAENIAKTDTTPSCNAGATVQGVAELKKLPLEHLTALGL
ncbi:MAG: CHC2 zinc finger domain-containing protein [Desulfobacterales bacterium]|jgi:hypothetical protein